MNNNKTFKTVIWILIVIECGTVYLLFKSLANKPVELNDVNIKESKFEAAYYTLAEQTYGAKDYEIMNTSFDRTNYVYNEEKSTCFDQYGQELKNMLSYDYETGYVTIESLEARTCYFYYDLKAPIEENPNPLD